MERARRFERHRYLGDRRSLRVHDVDALGDESRPVIEELLRSGQATCFAPDTLAEARNRGYRPARG